MIFVLPLPLPLPLSHKTYTDPRVSVHSADRDSFDFRRLLLNSSPRPAAPPPLPIMASARRAPFSGLLAALSGLILLLATSVSAGLSVPFLNTRAEGDKYLLGVGKADITGPVVEIGFAGYADLAQKGTGLRQRLYSRAFIVGDVNKPDDRFVYLVLDVLSGDTAMRYGILESLEALGDDYSAYGSHNIAVTGTHSHAGSGAWFNYLLPQITTFGFDKQGYQAIVDGAVLSIKRAHESLEEVRPGSCPNTTPMLTSHRDISMWPRPK